MATKMSQKLINSEFLLCILSGYLVPYFTFQFQVDILCTADGERERGSQGQSAFIPIQVSEILNKGTKKTDQMKRTLLRPNPLESSPSFAALIRSVLLERPR